MQNMPRVCYGYPELHILVKNCICYRSNFGINNWYARYLGRAEWRLNDVTKTSI